MSALDDLIDSVNFDYGTGNDFYTEQEIEKARGELEALRAELADVKGYYERVISEPCSSGEQHCTCVPALRAENAAKHDALITMAMFLTNVNTIHEGSQARLIQQLVEAREQDIADAIAESGFATALEQEKKS